LPIQTDSLYKKKPDGVFTFVRSRGFIGMSQDQLRFPVAFEKLMQQHEREILRYLLRVLGDREDAADLFQETWLRAYRAYSRLHAQADSRSWLYAIAVNLCRNRARSGARRRRVIVPETHADVSNGRALPGAPRAENDGYLMLHMRELIAGLPQKQREAFCLRYFAGLDYGAIAAVLHCSQTSARANVSHAARKLKAMW
jgi:RNA polymerase sigma-70 factor (ECF subfamily)